MTFLTVIAARLPATIAKNAPAKNVERADDHRSVAENGKDVFWCSAAPNIETNDGRHGSQQITRARIRTPR
jgi:hypothetical protein